MENNFTFVMGAKSENPGEDKEKVLSPVEQEELEKIKSKIEEGYQLVRINLESIKSADPERYQWLMNAASKLYHMNMDMVRDHHDMALLKFKPIYVDLKKEVNSSLDPFAVIEETISEIKSGHLKPNELPQDLQQAA